ncbi:MAG: cytochrome o ubiquinol oxidase subunit I [Gammaproteobacteria bacterium RIFCSPLOWO2_02_FULL_42_14]|nr:MAG: cytochrome o ubiquinol oxidase subunit I [Gammaproteobacteria bacterium RIFCSPHIGHO2_02_FULL_42_43]OGT52014.1 MAG: cytochrome o ubiquinol oxidase subunit I [Gammaproteobacteria bacterium RIFCSPHIGHO2_12_FULL_41_25]OGT61119.1 MAG: cytochrome o ubiquinol oxidase subunit I [Gammaproteobacteria bacterium RIFCSPLOWO2_02_FULL_42_14]OGT87047.1 MAG: cytochrome o ubiquinol oxidase subunit I [Gammaproteobacteria bacterium RIFCSPLOWO2_12_FULL_42_18]
MTLQKFIFGNLTLDSVPWHVPIIMGAGAFMALGALTILGLITYYQKWTYLWKEWLTSIDHKKIGIMYLILSLVMLLRGFSDAIMMRSQQAMAVGHNMGYLPPEHFDQIFTAHGVIMIFFVAMPMMFGLLNMAVPLQIGARDVAFPYLNSLSLWLTVVGSVLVNMSLVIGKFAATGWLAYPPLSGIVYSPGVGVDYYIWALQISGVGSLLSGVNFMVTILKMRCPGMTLMKMPIFCWTALSSMVLVALAFPILAATLGMLFLDRIVGMHFFTTGHGGNAMMYINLIWAWGHPEVYILILPAFGIFSEVVATFSRKRLFGYVSMVYATVVITLLSFIVWLHHFFTMGAGANVNAFFGIATMIIAIPTGVKIFNWLFTMYDGRVTFSTPMLWTIGFISTFAIGGMTGVLMSVPPVDFQLHNSVFLVAHFHNVIIGGVIFGYFAGVTYWFPKLFGYHLNEKWGKRAFWCWLPGFYIAFMPLYALGLMGMTRRLDHYATSTGWHPLLMIAAAGTAVIGAGITCQVIQLIVSIKERHLTRDLTGDSWVNGRTLEWSIPSPAPFYNFAVTPHGDERDAFWEMKQKHLPNPNIQMQSHYADIHMPRNTSVGFVIAMLSGIFGFGIIWQIYWMVALGLFGIFATVMHRTFNQHTDYYVTSDEVIREMKRVQMNQI